MIKCLRSKGDRNHRSHLGIQIQRVLYQRIAAFVSVRVRERRTDLLLVQRFEAAKGRCRLFAPAQALQNLGQAKLGRCMYRIKPQSSLELGKSLVRLMQFKKNRTQKVVRVRVVRIECRYFLKAFQGLRILRFNAVQNPQRVPDMRILRILGRGLFERFLRLRHLLQIDQGDSAIYLGLNQGRVELVGIREFGSRFIQQLLVHQRSAKVIRLRRVRLLGRCDFGVPDGCGYQECGENEGSETHSARLQLYGIHPRL